MAAQEIFMFYFARGTDMLMHVFLSLQAQVLTSPVQNHTYLRWLEVLPAFQKPPTGHLVGKNSCWSPVHTPQRPPLPGWPTTLLAHSPSLSPNSWPHVDVLLTKIYTSIGSLNYMWMIWEQMMSKNGHFMLIQYSTIRAVWYLVNRYKCQNFKCPNPFSKL